MNEDIVKEAIRSATTLVIEHRGDQETRESVKEANKFLSNFFSSYKWKKDDTSNPDKCMKIA